MNSAYNYYTENILTKCGVAKLTESKYNRIRTEHLNPYYSVLWRKGQDDHFDAIFEGFLNDLTRKTIRSMAISHSSIKDAEGIGHFLSSAKFDDDAMKKIYQKDVAATLTDPKGLNMLVLDETGIAKQGKESVGVANQYCGNKGKVCTSQVGVILGYCSSKGHALFDFQLYFSEIWFTEEYRKKWARCHIPEKTVFKTKNQLGIEAILAALEEKIVKIDCIGFDAAYGNDSKFVDSLPDGIIYFGDVPKDHHVFEIDVAMVTPEYKGRGRKPGEVPSRPARTVEDIAKDPSFPWVEPHVLDNGSQGPVIYKTKYARVRLSRDGKPGKEVWLYVRELSKDKIKYALCNEPSDASISDVSKWALMRWSIEQNFKETKSQLGIDQYMHRSLTAWYRHMLIGFIAHLFVIKLGLKFGIKIESPAPAPLVTAPVTLSEYIEALIQHILNKPIDHPNIITHPKEMVQILSIGLMLDCIRKFIPQKSISLADIEEKLKIAFGSFLSRINQLEIDLIGEEELKKLRGDASV